MATARQRKRKHERRVWHNTLKKKQRKVARRFMRRHDDVIERASKAFGDLAQKARVASEAIDSTVDALEALEERQRATYEAMTTKDLRHLVRDRGIDVGPGLRLMKKDTIIEHLISADYADIAVDGEEALVS